MSKTTKASNGKAGSDKAASAQEAAQTGLPLFLKNPRPLDAEVHGTAGLKKDGNFNFAQQTNSVPITLAELPEAALYYPIVFTGDDSALPVVVLGLEQSNYFVSDKGQWNDANYIPAYVRQYPFVLMEVDNGKRLVLCVDEAAESFTAKGPGNAFFEADKKPTAFTQGALDFCTAVHQQHMLTRGFVEVLKQYDLLSLQGIQVNVSQGKTIRLSGFKILDEAKFNQLPGETILKLREQGYLGLIYMVLASSRNWPKLARFATLDTRKAA
ncbi:SapC family protein [bacterium]|nr:SapC family protein [bacterium]